MKKQSLQSMSAQVRRAADAAHNSHEKLTQLIDELAEELVFRSSVSSLLEDYRQELGSGDSVRSLNEVMDEVESSLLLHAVRCTDGNLARAAELLRLPEATLRYRMAKFGLR